MVRFHGLTAAATCDAICSSSGEHRGPTCSLHPPPLIEAMGADSLVPRGPEPVMDRVVTNELPITLMGPCGVGHIPCFFCRTDQGKLTCIQYIYTQWVWTVIDGQSGIIHKWF